MDLILIGDEAIPSALDTVERGLLGVRHTPVSRTYTLLLRTPIPVHPRQNGAASHHLSLQGLQTR